VSGFLSELRSGDYVTRERVRLWAVALLAAYAIALGFMLTTAHGVNDYHGRPIGSDFSDVYAAGRLVLQGESVAPFHPLQQHAQEQALFGKATPFYGWHYPPFFYFVSAPLASLPYLASLFAWQAVTLVLYLVGLWILLRNGPASELVRDRLWLVLALGFPAVFVNITHGHNGFLTAALFAGALAVLDKRPLLAGCLFALLAYKPQFGLMIPIALIAEGRWRTIGAAIVTVAVMVLVTTAAFGVDIWRAFFESLSFTRTVALEQGGAGFFKIQSVFAWVRMWHGPVALAYALQILSTGIAGALLFRFWRSDASRAQKGAALCIASLLATPYCFDYDMMAIAPAIALLAADGFAHGFRSWQKAAAAGLWLMPLFARPVAAVTLMPVGVPVLLAAFLLLTWSYAPSPQLKPVS
jgi:hypothetical protein